MRDILTKKWSIKLSQVARIGDACGEGLVVTGSDTVFINGIPVGRIGDAISPHGNGEHASAEIATGSATVFANNIPVARVGDSATCGDIIESGSPDVEVNS